MFYWKIRVDPHFFNYPSFSPYTYVGNNPIILVDPDGRDWYRSHNTGREIWYEGSGTRDGYDHIGPNIWLKGKNGYLYHHQNEYIREMPFDEFYRSGVVFTAAIGGGQEDKYGNPRAYVDIGDMLTIFSFQGAYVKANPRNIRGIFSKLSNIFAAWETGHHLGNEFNIQNDAAIPVFSFDGRPAHNQLSIETIRLGNEQIRGSDDYLRLIRTFGVDTLNAIKKDTIIPFSVERYKTRSGQLNTRTTALSPILKGNP